MFNSIDRGQCVNLVVGVLGIYFIYILSGIFHELILKDNYVNNRTGEMEPPIYCPEGLVFLPNFVTWVLGALYNRFFLPEANYIPNKNAFYCGMAAFVSTFTYTHAIVKTNFPVVMVFKSSNILSVILVALICTRVKDKELNLGRNKIIVGGLLTIGVLMFNIFDPETQARQASSEVIGIVLLIVSLLADGFLPDFQAQIKSTYKPAPTEMMAIVNKWTSIISFTILAVNFRVVQFFVYYFEHHLYAFHLGMFSILAFFGQVVVYRMIKQFKQHIVPMVITTRKIITIVISILFVGNKRYSFLEFMGVFIIFTTVMYEFSMELQKGDKTEIKNSPIPTETSMAENIDIEQPSSSGRNQLQMSREIPDEEQIDQ